MIAASDAPTFDAGGATITGLASPRRGAEDIAAWRLALEPDSPSPTHSLAHQEVFVVLSGAVTARFADREETAEAGGALIVPTNEEFSLLAKDGRAEAVCMLPIGGHAVVDGHSFTPPWAE